MKAIERVMKAYLSTRKLSVEQAELVRTNLTKCIDELLAARPRVQRPTQPSARLNEPPPLLPDIFPVDVRTTPSFPTAVDL
jgi:hypothetical protein